LCICFALAAQQTDRVMNPPAGAVRLTDESGLATDPAISSDGRWLAFASDRGGTKFLRVWIQPYSGGIPRRLTTGSGDDHEPVFSPDGRHVAYRSESGSGGIYLVAVNGGKPQLLIPNGRTPRFSPDGRRIAYWIAAHPGASGPASQIFVIPTSGGSSTPLQPTFHSATHPVWSPDGTNLLFYGCQTRSPESCDLWVIPASAGEAAPTGVARVLREQQIPGAFVPQLWRSAESTVIFTVENAGVSRLWRVRVLGDPWRIASTPERLLASEADQRNAAIGSDGRLVFANRTKRINLWSLPVRADQARPAGALVRITDGKSIDQRPSLARDGKRIAWETSRSGEFDVWVKDLASGEERAITRGPLREHMPALSSDGTQLVYDVHDGERVTILRSAFTGGDPVRIWEENVGQGSFQWTSAGDQVLYFHREPPGTVGLMALSTKKRTVLLRHPKLNLSLADARLSPDGRWIAFPVPSGPHSSRLAVAAVTGKPVSNERDWTYVTSDVFNTAQPEWSPNGSWLYFLSDQTGKLAVWALALSSDKRPNGAPRLVLDFATARLNINEMRPRDTGLSVARDKLALAVAEYESTLWSVKP
jgi:Tol biopolymer transport system component